MKIFAGCSLVAALILGAVGCQHLDLAPESDPERVVAGTVTLSSDQPFPADAELVVRVLDTTPQDRPRPTTGLEPPIVDRTTPQFAERVLGEQVIRAPGAKPIPFRVEFRADDLVMRRGLNIDARISQGGKLRYRSFTAHLVTLGSLQFPHEVFVEPVE